MLIFDTVSQNHYTVIQVYILRIRCGQSLAKLKCEMWLVYMQDNVSDSEALFWCFVFIILRMASLDTLFFCSVAESASLALFLATS